MTAPNIANLKHVTYSKPQLLHQDSRQSIAASDDYYSFSDQVSDKSTSSKVTVVRYATPSSQKQSHPSSPRHSPALLGPEIGTSMASVNETESPPPATAGTVRFGETRVMKIGSGSQSLNPISANQGNRPDISNAPTPGVDDTPYIRFAIDQLTRDEEVVGAGRQSSIPTTDYPVERIVGDEGLGYFTRASSGPTSTQPKGTQRSSLPRPRSVKSDHFIPIELTAEDHHHPPLDYVPIVLRSWALAIFIFLCLLMIAGIGFCNTWSQRYQGLWDYDGVGGSRYFVVEFLPQLLAALLVLWTFVIQAALYRVMPFSIMASERQLNGVLQHLSLLPRNFILPDLSHFKHGEALIGFSLLIFWLSNLLTIPLQSCLFQTQFHYIDGQGIWRWTSVQPIGWTLITIYSLLVIVLLLLVLRFYLSWTGLLWDPVSLADIIPLIQASNILNDFDRSETVLTVGDFVTPKILRLGYWKTTEREDLFYGIGGEHTSGGDRSSRQSTKSIEKRPLNPDADLEQQPVLRDETFERNLHSPFIRYRWTVWFLRDTFLLAWIAIALLLFIALVVVSFLHNTIQGGFLPLLPTLPAPNGFSASNFLYSFIPSLLGNLLFLMWQPVDVYFRAVQPFATLSNPKGTPAENSILLSYPACFPLETTFLALIAGHYKVAWTSFISVISLAIPVLSGGVFLALYYPSEDQIRISASLSAYYTLIVFCALYMLSFFVIFPRRKRYLPHDIYTIADIVSFLYQSSLLTDPILREPRTKADLVTRLVIPPPGEKQKPIYGFGIYRGRDGRDHLGIDRLHRPGKADMLITTASMK